jgi:aspartate-semialdehyde dehydrogenase
METKVKNDPVVAIAGVTGAVGAEFIATMDKRAFRVGKLKALASVRSVGKAIDFRGQSIVVEELNEASFEGVDIALFSAGGSIARKFAPIAVRAGAVVVDNSSAFRMDPDVPLVIPEINANRIGEHKGVIANPNCSAITALVPLWPIHRANRIKRVILSTYQAASGAGAAAMQELVDSTRACLDGQTYQPKVLPHFYAFNLFNHDSTVDPATGYSGEETKVTQETRKIFEDNGIAVGVTCVRVPVLRAHSQAITFECENTITEHEVRAILIIASDATPPAISSLEALRTPAPAVRRATFMGPASANLHRSGHKIGQRLSLEALSWPPGPFFWQSIFSDPCFQKHL